MHDWMPLNCIRNRVDYIHNYRSSLGGYLRTVPQKIMSVKLSSAQLLECHDLMRGNCLFNNLTKRSQTKQRQALMSVIFIPPYQDRVCT